MCRFMLWSESSLISGMMSSCPLKPLFMFYLHPTSTRYCFPTYFVALRITQSLGKPEHEAAIPSEYTIYSHRFICSKSRRTWKRIANFIRIDQLWRRDRPLTWDSCDRVLSLFAWCLGSALTDVTVGAFCSSPRLRRSEQVWCAAFRSFCRRRGDAESWRDGWHHTVALKWKRLWSVISCSRASSLASFFSEWIYC